MKNLEDEGKAFEWCGSSSELRGKENVSARRRMNSRINDMTIRGCRLHREKHASRRNTIDDLPRLGWIAAQKRGMRTDVGCVLLP